MFWHVRCQTVIWECYQLWPFSCKQKTHNPYSTAEKAGQLHSFIIGYSNSYLTTNSSYAWAHASTQRNDEWPNTGLLTLSYFVLLWYSNDNAVISGVILSKQKNMMEGKKWNGMRQPSVHRSSIQLSISTTCALCLTHHCLLFPQNMPDGKTDNKQQKRLWISTCCLSRTGKCHCRNPFSTCCSQT